MDTSRTHDLWPDHVSMSAFSDQSHYTPVDMAPNSLISSTPIGTPSLSTLTGTPLSTPIGSPSLSTVAGYEGASSAHSDEEPDEPFKCPKCGKRFAVKQSVGRHYRKRHDPNPCLFSSDGCGFKWGGPSDYGHHLRARHNLKDDVINTMLGKKKESRCRATIIGRKI